MTLEWYKCKRCRAWLRSDLHDNNSLDCTFCDMFTEDELKNINVKMAIMQSSALTCVIGEIKDELKEVNEMLEEIRIKTN